MFTPSGRRSSVAGSPHSEKKSHKPAGAMMSSMRAGPPSTSKLCGVEGGDVDEVARVAGELLVGDEEAHASLEQVEALAAEVVAVKRRTDTRQRQCLDHLELGRPAPQDHQRAQRPDRVRKFFGGLHSSLCSHSESPFGPYEIAVSL